MSKNNPQMKNKNFILGAGITGLSAGLSANTEIFESSKISGGICASYYMKQDGTKSYRRDDSETYRFEVGGGHWIFGADNKVLNLINSLSPVKSYERRSSVYFPDLGIYVPYPLQNHLCYLPDDIKNKALNEILNSREKRVITLADWLELNFGKTLCELFFFPFHELYTAGLYTEIAPQDAFKTPINKDLIIKGSKEKTPSIGYNATFVYPTNGLDDLLRHMAEKCHISFDKRAVGVDVKAREILFEDGGTARYGSLISTMPLNMMADMAEVNLCEPDPYTSVLVINIGAKKGIKCPNDQWIYVPKSKAGFHRVGFYSNVDPSFLPEASRKDNNRVSIYVEIAYLNKDKPRDEEIKNIGQNIVEELKGWGFISEAEVVDSTWIDYGYTWQYPGSNWVNESIKILTEHKIYQIGRYGKWKFQGIADSIEDGFSVKAELEGL